MLLINKTDELQRTTVQWVKRDIKPWEIFDVRDNEFDMLKSYANIFWQVKIKEVKTPIKTKK